MISYGVWSDAAGGFIDTDNYSMGSAENARAYWIDQGEDSDDLTILEMCEYHEEQPRTGCEGCEYDDEGNDQ